MGDSLGRAAEYMGKGWRSGIVHDEMGKTSGTMVRGYMMRREEGVKDTEDWVEERGGKYKKREDSSDCGGMSTPGHGQGEGPDGDKWSLDHAGNVGRGRSERSERSPLQSLLSSRCNIK